MYKLNGFWRLVNRVVLSFKFGAIDVSGKEHIPTSGPFILVSNHISRFDGLLIHKMIDGQANFMVSPNELKGFQGRVLTSMGAFPALASRNVVDYASKFLSQGEALVIFPEGNIFLDGNTHPFKSGAARIALACAQKSMNLPVIPCAIHYSHKGSKAHIAFAPPIDIAEYQSLPNTAYALKCLSQRMYREVCFLRYGLNAVSDKSVLFC